MGILLVFGMHAIMMVFGDHDPTHLFLYEIYFCPGG